MLVLVDYIEVTVRKKRFSRNFIKVLRPIYEDMGKGSYKMIKTLIYLEGMEN